MQNWKKCRTLSKLHMSLLTNIHRISGENVKSGACQYIIETNSSICKGLWEIIIGNM